MGNAEGYVENYLKKEAEKRNYFITKFTAPGKRGMPDRILIAKGYTIFIECKSPIGNTRKQQDIRIHEIRKNNGIAFAIKTRQAVDALMQKLDNITPITHSEFSSNDIYFS